LLICVLFHTILFDHYHIVLHKVFMNIVHTLFLLFCIGKICCSDQQPEPLLGLSALSVTKLSDSPVEFSSIINFPAELRLIIADYSDNFKGAYCLFTKKEIKEENSIYYKCVLKKYLEKIVQGIAIKNLRCENYEKGIFKTWKYSLSLVSTQFIAVLNYYYKKYMDNPSNVITHCNANLFTLKQGLLLRELCPQINVVSPEEIYNDYENVKLQAAIITQQNETCTLHRIMNRENFFDCLNTHFLNTNIPPAVLFKRVTVFKEYQNSDVIEMPGNFWVLNFIDKQEEPLLCKLITNKKLGDIRLYSYSFIKIIVDMGADVNVTNEWGYTPLLVCPYRFHEDDKEIAELLISKGADVNAKTTDGDSVLHIAIINKRIEMIKLLLENGADINAKNHKNETPLDLAILYKYTDITELLVEKGAKTNAKYLQK